MIESAAGTMGNHLARTMRDRVAHTICDRWLGTMCDRRVCNLLRTKTNNPPNMVRNKLHTLRTYMLLRLVRNKLRTLRGPNPNGFTQPAGI